MIEGYPPSFVVFVTNNVQCCVKEQHPSPFTVWRQLQQVCTAVDAADEGRLLLGHRVSLNEVKLVVHRLRLATSSCGC